VLNGSAKVRAIFRKAKTPSHLFLRAFSFFSGYQTFAKNILPINAADSLNNAIVFFKHHHSFLRLPFTHLINLTNK
jgi:hypothetical protein